MTSLKIVTFWVHPSGESLPEAKALLDSVLQGFYQAFPEYQGSLVFSQSPRRPRHVFVYVSQNCAGLLPQAGSYLQHLLEQAFPAGEVRPYGKPWHDHA